MPIRPRCLVLSRLLAAAAAIWCWSAAAQAAVPIRIGCSLALTGGVAANGKQALVGFQIWRDEINAKGGLLGRPVEILCYDDQSSSALVPSIYTKLIEVDKVDLTVGPYATNMVVPAIPVLMQHGRVTIGLTALAANSQFHYDKYFSMLSVGPDPRRANSESFFRLAAQQNPRPRTVAIAAADAEFAKNSSDGARDNARTAGLEIVYDKTYPPSTTDYAPIVRAIAAANPDILYVASYNPDTVGIIRAASETGLKVKMFGGNMVGLSVAATQKQLGPLLNGMVSQEFMSPLFTFPGLQDVLKEYRGRAVKEGIDPVGYLYAPFAYASLQVLGDAVTATGSLDQDKIAAYIHAHDFKTVAGDIAFGPDGEWTKARVISTQYQHLTGTDPNEFHDPKKLVVVGPSEYRTADFIYPRDEAGK